MPSFDTVCEANLVEVKNAVENTAKEIATRFDFKGTSASIEIKDKDITLIGDADFQLTQIEDVLRNKLTKRNVDVRFLDMGDVQKIGGDKVKQVIKVRNGIESELAKKIQKLMKESKLKVQAAIQEDKVRVTGAKRDDLQAAMALIRKDVTDVPLSFDNFRDLDGAPPESLRAFPLQGDDALAAGRPWLGVHRLGRASSEVRGRSTTPSTNDDPLLCPGRAGYSVLGSVLGSCAGGGAGGHAGQRSG